MFSSSAYPLCSRGYQIIGVHPASFPIYKDPVINNSLSLEWIKQGYVVLAGNRSPPADAKCVNWVHDG